jgi:dynein heavy chain
MKPDVGPTPPSAYTVQVVSVLFFVISELAGVSPMYQYSLAWFVGLFEATLLKADRARDLGRRIDSLVQHFQYSLYLQVRCVCACARVGVVAGGWQTIQCRQLCCMQTTPLAHNNNNTPQVCRSLFEKDKLLFAFLMTVHIKAHVQHSLDASSLHFLLTGGLSSAEPPPNPAAAWLSDKQWGELVRLAASMAVFEGLQEAFTSDQAAFKVCMRMGGRGVVRGGE